MTSSSARAVLTELSAQGGELNAAQVNRVTRELFPHLATSELLTIVLEVLANTEGLGLLQSLRLLPGLSDIVVNAPDQIWYDAGSGLCRSTLTFQNETELRALVLRLAGQAGRRLDSAMPMVDAMLPEGVRLHATLPPVSKFPLLSLRFPNSTPLSLTRLVELGGLTPEGRELLQSVVSARLNFLVTGGTGTGKTTVLGALLGEVPADERIVIAEDTAELLVKHEHVVALQTRQSNADGIGEISLRSLVRSALRMRPDRIVVGEVRGPEVVDLLAALNTGHAGSCGTVHANSTETAVDRLLLLGLMAGLPRAAIWALIHSSIQCLIGLRWAEGRRVIEQLAVLTSDGVQPAAQLWPIFRRDTGWAELERRLCGG